MKKNQIIRRVLSFTLAFCLLAFCVPQTMPVQSMGLDYQQQLDELNKKYNELEKEQKKINANINKAKSDKEKQLAEKTNITGQINLTKEQISVLNSKVEILDQNITSNENLMVKNEQDLGTTYDLFKDRLRSMYMCGSTSTIGLILGADSFSEFLTRLEVVSRISKHDTVMMNKIIDQRKYIEAIKETLDADKAELEDTLSQLEGKKSDLDGKMTAVNQQIQDISALEAQFTSDSKKIKQQMAEMQKEIDDVFAKLNSVGDYVGGIFAWPVPGYKTITSDYGWRFNHTNWHTGIDISGAGVYGKPIAAANNGKVAFVQRNYVPGKGYGMYVIIDHGGGIQTLYGHTSDIYVEVGQTVKKGDIIAAVGSTGWSTGPHLHFEVRVNKKDVNPWTYLK